MPPAVSIIIPTKNSGSTIYACLASIKSQTYPHTECIVVDNGSSDATVAIASSLGIRTETWGNERSAQRNYGARISKGEYLLFIDSDMELEKGVVAECVQAIAKDKNLQALIISEQSFGFGFWASCKAFERASYSSLPWMSAARFLSRHAFERSRGFDETLVGGEDFDLQNRLAHAFGAKGIGRISSVIRHNEGSPSLGKLWRKKYYYGKTIHIYQKKAHNRHLFQRQASPLQRIIAISSDPQRIIRHPVVYAGTVFMKITEFIAGALGYIKASRYNS